MKEFRIFFRPQRRDEPFTEKLTLKDALQARTELEAQGEPIARSWDLSIYEAYALIEFSRLKHVPRALLHGFYLLHKEGKKKRGAWWAWYVHG